MGKKEVVDKLNKIEKEFSRLEKIKKPKEPKETTKPKKVKTTDKASGDSSKEKTEAEDFPSDIEEAKKLLVSVGDEKMTAITSEASRSGTCELVSLLNLSSKLDQV